jgi:hypothetical protein
MQFIFGSGSLWAVPTVDLTGAAITVPTPVPFGVLQDVSLDLSSTLKELRGLYQDPVEVARGARKTTGKAKFARFEAAAFNLVFGETLLTGEIKAKELETGTVAGNSVTVANNSTFTVDLGVTYAANGVRMTRGATATGNGVYACNASNGVYTFNAGDNNAAVLLSYLYTANALPGQNFIINNQLMGVMPKFKVVINGKYGGKNMTITLNSCISSKLSLATKLEDWTIPEFDFQAMADANNQMGSFSFAGS